MKTLTDALFGAVCIFALVIAGFVFWGIYNPQKPQVVYVQVTPPPVAAPTPFAGFGTNRLDEGPHPVTSSVDFGYRNYSR